MRCYNLLKKKKVVLGYWVLVSQNVRLGRKSRVSSNDEGRAVRDLIRNVPVMDHRTEVGVSAALARTRGNGLCF